MKIGLLSRMSWTAIALICVMFLLAQGEKSIVRSNEAIEPGAQDVMNLDRRISVLEQRLFTIESSVNRLQQQAFSQRSTPAPGQNDVEMNLLRTQIELLMGRLREVECGLVHLDERTLPGTAKAARDRAGAQGREPCRLNPETPILLSPRQ
ncbi:MAG TPA: hypothetical protein VKM94_00610 [Blastocatellia bacterium]|nr:hypothetical protein [Blastocatellia bacterium]